LFCKTNGCQMTRKREDHMDVARWEKLLATCCEPAIASSCLHFGQADSTGVVGDGEMSAASALIEMSAEPAVRHRAIARSTLTCFQVIHLRLR